MKTAPKTLEVLANEIKMSDELKKFILTQKAVINGKEVIDITKYEIPSPKGIGHYNEISRRFHDFIKNCSKCKQKIIIPALGKNYQYYYCSLNKGDINKLIDLVKEFSSDAAYLNNELNQCDGILVRQVKGVYDMHEEYIDLDPALIGHGDYENS